MAKAADSKGGGNGMKIKGKIVGRAWGGPSFYQDLLGGERNA